MTDEEKIELIRSLFVGRDDCYLEQWVDERGTHYGKVDRQLTRRVIKTHLLGTKTISAYQIAKDDTVKFLCFDVDVSPKGKATCTEEEWLTVVQDTTKSVVAILFRLGIPFRVETSGGKGYHIWVFFDRPVLTRKAYLLGNFVHTYIPKDDRVNVEVFPKQEEYVGGFGYGIKIPLGIHQRTQRRCFFVDNTFTPHKDQWKILQTIKPLTTERIDAIIKEWGIQDERPAVPQDTAQDYMCMSRIMNDGVTNGNRDTGIFQLACFLRGQGLSYGMADAVLAKVPDQGDPPMNDKQREIKLRSAYDKNYAPSPCKDRNLDEFCSSSCVRWPTKLKNEWTRYGRKPDEAVGVISRD